MKRKIFLGILAVILIALVWNYKLVDYGLAQARGQLHIIWNARPVEEVLNDSTVADSIKSKLLLIQEIRQYAIDSLGLNDTDNYTTLFDQKGKPVLWVVTASEPYALKAKKWGFPIIGSFSYKGFFNKERAIKEKNKLTEEGWDTGIRTAGGWSTLGWFKDPILSNMLRRSEGDLANLIIHELTHGTIFVKDQLEFNENLATFIGDMGARKFLRQKYGYSSKEYTKYDQGETDEKRFIRYILKGADALDSLYQTFDDSNSIESKKLKKEELIDKIANSLDTVSFYNTSRYQRVFEKRKPNNTYFMSYMRYRSKQSELKNQFETEFNGNLGAFIDFMKEKYPFL
ncbi:MAG: aminopeptidase [Bacteroidota bacterium]